MHNKALLLINLLVMALPTTGYAHIGEHHGDGLTVLQHFITSPVHFGLTITAVLLLGVGIYLRRKRAHARRSDK